MFLRVRMYVRSGSRVSYSKEHETQWGTPQKTPSDDLSRFEDDLGEDD